MFLWFNIFEVFESKIFFCYILILIKLSLLILLMFCIFYQNDNKIEIRIYLQMFELKKILEMNGFDIVYVWND